MSDVRVQVLGSGDPFASGGRLQTCILVECDEGRALIDCGMTVMASMARFGIDAGMIDAVFVTHLHGDHFGGLPLMILEASMSDREGSAHSRRTRPLHIAGPAATEARTREALALFSWERSFGAMTDAGLLRFTSLEPRRATLIGPFTVTAFPVLHTPEAMALRVTCAGKTVAWSGDTEWTDALAEVSANADLFICMAYTFDREQRRLLSYRTLMTHWERLTCKRLLLGHIGAQMQQHLAESLLKTAADGMTIVL
jgi:ribonuclease BN (tRNA processing enzyme)